MNSKKLNKNENEKLKQLFSEVLDEEVSKIPPEDSLNYEFSGKFKEKIKEITEEEKQSFFKKHFSSPSRLSALSGACCLVLVLLISLSVGMKDNFDGDKNIVSETKTQETTIKNKKNKQQKKTTKSKDDKVQYSGYDKDYPAQNYTTKAQKKTVPKENTQASYYSGNTTTVSNKDMVLITPSTPDGYSVSSKNILDDEYTLTWENTNGDKIAYSQSIVVDMPTSGDKVSVNGVTGILVKTTDDSNVTTNSVYWEKNGYQFVLSSSSVSSESLIAIGNSLS